MIYASIQLSRPEHVAAALANLDRQEHPHRAIIVEGPDVRGAWPRERGDLVLECDDRSPAAARNVALDHVSALGVERTPEGYVHPRLAWLDEDDWYGPQYLAEVAAALDEGAIARRGTVHVQLSDGERVVLRDGPGRELRLGGTLAARVWQGLPRFNEEAPIYSEDGRWVWECQQASLTTAAVYDSDQYLWIRHAPVGRSGISDDLIRRIASKGDQ